ncbi:probable cation-transporting ATPase 13A3 isoform X2 [Asterias rubens]|uniref:probable cation-transporting ATPase 13A3 isoform X2 n=1 Tax=Asterias rubens TaxID=7604 RepID=UPI001455B444|nr:probable cation-transporting ATPase 13A3 isoform X2 [Asterias rubens]
MPRAKLSQVNLGAELNLPPEPDSGCRDYDITKETKENEDKRMHSPLPERTILNEGGEDEVECYGLKRNIPRTILCYILGFFTLGIFIAALYWKPNWKAKFMYRQTRLDQADTVLLKDMYKQWFLVRVQVSKDALPKEKRKKVEETKCDNANKTNGDQSHEFMRFFRFQKLKYIWETEGYNFFRLRGLESGVPCSDMYDAFTGFTADEQKTRRDLYGPNEIDIALRSIFVLFVQEALNPFYVFQVYSICLWIFGFNYILFSVAIMAMSLISITLTVYSTRTQSVTLRRMVKTTGTVTVNRGGQRGVEEVCVTDLVPGDLVELPTRGCMMSCDAVLISGSCIVNESMLTGESVPITKTPLPCPPMGVDDHPLMFDPENHKRHTLYCGTEILQGRPVGKQPISAVVVRTGFSTAKGDLVRSILFPKPIDFKLHRDALRFICMLAVFAFCGAVFVTVIKITHNASTKDIILKALDVFTIAVPPALPAALTIGMVYAQARLKNHKIFCISPQRINLSGMLDVICFDKTGTLTEDHLELLAVSPVNSDGFVMVSDPSKIQFGPFVAAMATCHSLTIIDGELKGDPLDLQMFHSIKWNLEEPKDGELGNFDHSMPTVVYSSDEEASDAKRIEEIGILRQFTFSSGLQRMSVVAKTTGSPNFSIFVKGAPETVALMCDPASVPGDFEDVLKDFTQQGLRVLAIACRELGENVGYDEALKLQRSAVECDLQMLGLIIMQNTLKPQTTPVIAKLKKADLRVVMVTGDNKLTAIHMARKCGMIGPTEAVIEVEATPPLVHGQQPSIKWTPVEAHSHHSNNIKTNCRRENGQVPEEVQVTFTGAETAIDINSYHFAMDGKTFAVIAEYYPELMPKIATRGTVFARMSPDQKAQLIEAIQDLHLHVGMCGDGANDCGALKTAHTGISLSEAEASVASPFTSQIQNIECVPTLIKEGRAALVTSFGVFKYMAVYSMIQFSTVIILNSVDAFPSDAQFMYWDIAITTTVALLIARNEAYQTLVKRKPQAHLIDSSILFSVFGHIFIQFIVQILAYIMLIAQPWFTPLEKIEGSIVNYTNYETTTMFCISSFQYIVVSFLFSKGPPYRKPIYTNILFTIDLVVLLLFTIFVVMVEVPAIYNFIPLKTVPLDFRFMILGLAVAYFLAAILLENFLAENTWLNQIISCRTCRSKSLSKHAQVEEELLADPNWPPLSSRPLIAAQTNGKCVDEGSVTQRSGKPAAEGSVETPV